MRRINRPKVCSALLTEDVHERTSPCGSLLRLGQNIEQVPSVHAGISSFEGCIFSGKASTQQIVCDVQEGLNLGRVARLKLRPRSQASQLDLCSGLSEMHTGFTSPRILRRRYLPDSFVTSSEQDACNVSGNCSGYKANQKLSTVNCHQLLVRRCFKNCSILCADDLQPSALPAVLQARANRNSYKRPIAYMQRCATNLMS